jgi:hypothetical protein
LNAASKPSLTLSDATSDDLASIDGIHVRSRQAASIADWRRRPPELPAGAGRVLIAQSQGELIGSVCAIARDAQRSVAIDNLHALPGHDRSGASSALPGPDRPGAGSALPAPPPAGRAPTAPARCP